MLRTPFLVLGTTLLAACSKSDDSEGTSPEPPDVSIAAPMDGDVLRQGKTIHLSGTVHDSADAPADLVVTWTFDGDLPVAIDVGEDGTVTADVDAAALSVGDHVARLEATDTDGDRASAEVGFSLLGPLGPPEVTITAPTDGLEVVTGDSITFVGEASDLATSAASLAFAWSSNLDGPLVGAAAESGVSTLTTSELSVGTHTVTLAVTDTDGEVGSDTVTVAVIEPPVSETFDAFQDFDVASNDATHVWQYGTATFVGGDVTLFASIYDDIKGIEGWTNDDLDVWPNLATNTTGEKIERGAVFPGRDFLSTHPGGSDPMYAVLRFVAPASGDWIIDAGFKSLDIGETDVHVVLNGDEIFEGYVVGPFDPDFYAGEAYADTLSLELGDTIDFVVGPGAHDYKGWDTTGVRASITRK